MKAKKKSQRITKLEQIPQEVLEQTKRGMESIERGESISEKEFWKRFRKLQNKKKPSKKKKEKK